MLPFCGYNMADYFDHWLRIGAAAASDPARLPRLYLVNWFRKDMRGKFVWPGFGDNARVLKWIVERVAGKAEARETPIGLLPETGSLDLSRVTLGEDQAKLLFDVDADVWREEAALSRAYLATFGTQLPPALWHEQEALEARLGTAA